MKRMIALLLALCLCVCLCACKSSEAKKADELILAIGEVSLDSKTAIQVAQSYYDTLTEGQKAEVENYPVLQSALESLEILERVAAVEECINAIGTVTIDSEARITAAESAYNALPEAEKSMVSNYDVLSDAQVEYTEVLIDAIGPMSMESGERIAAAQSRYNMLTSEQQSKVSNYAKMENAIEEIDNFNAALPEATKLISALNFARDKLEFIAKYAGNVNGKGSRKFADSFINDMLTTFDGIDMDLIGKGMPELAESVNEIETNYYTIVTLLIDMGDRNSPENVPTIKAMALETIDMIDELIASQLAYVESLQGT